MSDFDDLPETRVIVERPKETLRKRDEKALKLRDVKSLEDEVFREGIEVVRGSMRFTHIDPENPDVIPQGWIDEYGEAEAKRMHRAAKYALMNNKEAPIGVKEAHKLVGTLARARAMEKQAPNVLNVQLVKWYGDAPEQEYEEIDVTSHDENR